MSQTPEILQEQKGNRLGCFNIMYLPNLLICIGAIIHDLSTQEFIREGEVSGAISLNAQTSFLNENFVGDIGEAFACIFAVPVIIELINWSIQQSRVSESTKKLSEGFSLILPFLITILFLLGATDGESSQQIFKYGTADPKDLVGAYYGAAVALVSILKFRQLVFSRNKKVETPDIQ